MHSEQVWIVDDEPDLAAAFVDYIAGNISARAFSSSKELLAAYDAENPPSLIVTDVKMPGIDGIEMVEKLRAEAQNISVIMISGFAEKEHLVRAANLDINGFLEKPFKPDALLALIQHTMEQVRRADVMERVVAAYKEYSDLLGQLSQRYFERATRAENLIGAEDASRLNPTGDKAEFLLGIGLERELNIKIRALREEIARMGDSPQIPPPKLAPRLPSKE